jgi:lysophospholipase L1-like esterase
MGRRAIRGVTHPVESVVRADNLVLGRVRPLLAAVMLCLIAGRATPTEAANRWEGTIQRFVDADKETPPPQGGVLFVGSSSIRGWRTQRSFPGIQTLNRGFGGSRIADSLYFADRIVLPYRPRTIVFYAGDNDIAGGLSPERVLGDYLEFVQKVHATLPRTRIVFVAIKPSLARWQLVGKMRRANALIEAAAKNDPRLIYLDIDTPMIGPDGRPRGELFKGDGLHLSPPGYGLWNQWVTPYMVVPVDADPGEGPYPILGSVDLGPGRRCEVFSDADGGATVVLWQAKPGPVPKALAKLAATDPTGQPLDPPGDRPFVACYRLSELPEGWREQCGTECLSPTILGAHPGGTARVRLRVPIGASVRWETLGGGLIPEPPSRNGDIVTMALRLPTETPTGPRDISLAVEGTGWRKAWRGRLEVTPSARVESDPYLPNHPATIRVHRQDEGVSEATLSVPGACGGIEPATLRMESETTTATFHPAPGLQGPVGLSVRLSSGVVQTHTLRPGWADIPQAQGLVADGRLEDWPDGADLHPDALVQSDASFRPTLSMAWTQEGLWVACTLPGEGLLTGTSERWWRGTCLELVIDASEQPKGNWGSTSHQFYFIPIQGADGSWRVAKGEWKRGDAIAETIFEDPRSRAAFRADPGGGVVEMFVPAQALGVEVQAGATWRIGFSVQGCFGDGRRTTAQWPRGKNQGLFQGADAWGVVHLAGSGEGLGSSRGANEERK